MSATRLIVTADSDRWALTAAQVATGYATSVIGCNAEASVERTLAPSETPDHRPGVSILLFAFSSDALQKAAINRTGQCILTCPTTACFNGLFGSEKKIRIGGNLRFFGDGYQISKKLFDRRFWRIPVMDGEFLCEDSFGVIKGIGGGNFLILGETQAQTLAAAESAAEAIRRLPDVIMPFPGGLVRSGSKVGSRYKQLPASTNEAYCPTLRGIVDSQLSKNIKCVYEIVIDGLTEHAVRHAMNAGIKAACQPGVVKITAGNYGGKLGPHHFHLHDILSKDFSETKS